MEEKCKLIRPKAPRVADKCGRQVWETSMGDKYGRRVWETSVDSDGPRNPEWETSVGDNCKLMLPKAPRLRCKPGDRSKIMGPRDATL